MEQSHYSNSYFWTPIPTMAGQFENVMFINKIKEQLMAEKSCGPSPGPQTAPPQPQQQQQQQQVQTYSPPLITSGPISGVTQAPSADIKEGGEAQPVVTENVTVLPLPSALMTGLVITSPSASLSSSSSGLSPLAHPPAFSLAGAPAMIVSGLSPALTAGGQGVPSLAGLDKEAQEQAHPQAPGHHHNPPPPPPPPPAQDEGTVKTPSARKRKGRPSEPSLAELGDPYAVPNDDEGGRDSKSY
ncbi:zinc finger protein 384-like, partial [Cetorhinus maximus]